MQQWHWALQCHLLYLARLQYISFWNLEDGSRRYMCHQIFVSVAPVSYSYILFVIKCHRPSYLQICNISDFEMWKWETDMHHTWNLYWKDSFLQYLPGMDFSPFIFLAYPKSPLKLSLEQCDPNFKNRPTVLQLCNEAEQSKLQHSFN